jgi:hypothetical protein
MRTFALYAHTKLQPNHRDTPNLRINAYWTQLGIVIQLNKYQHENIDI